MQNNFLKHLIKFFLIQSAFFKPIFCSNSVANKQKNIYVDIGTHAFVKPTLRMALEQQGFSVIEQRIFSDIEKPYLFVSFEVRKENLAVFQAHQDKKPILILFEPPSVVPDNFDKALHEPFYKVYTWRDDLVDNKKYFKFFYYPMQKMIKPLKFIKKKLCVLVNAHKTSSHPAELYSERKKVIDFYEAEHPTEFDLYGRGWDGYSMYKGFGRRILTQDF